MSGDTVFVFRPDFAPDGTVTNVEEELPRSEVLRLLVGTEQRNLLRRDPHIRVIVIAEPDIALRFIRAARDRS